MRITSMVTLIAVIYFFAMTMPSAAQYYANNTHGYSNFHSYTGYGGRPNNQVSGIHSLAQTTGTVNSRSTRPHASHQSPSSMQYFERALNNATDSPQTWSQAPVVAPRTGNLQQSNAPRGNSYSTSRSRQALNGLLPAVSQMGNLTRAVTQGGSLYDGGAGSGYGGSSNQASNQSVRAAAGTTYSSCQRAENAATRARNAGNRARNDQDKWSRKDAANDAYNAANDARIAADQAARSAANGDSQARSYATQARGAANRARADADRARYNAETEY